MIYAVKHMQCMYAVVQFNNCHAISNTVKWCNSLSS